MSKFSLFTLFLACIIVVIIAELLVNEYVKDPYGTHLQANVMEAGGALPLTQQVAAQQASMPQQSGTVAAPVVTEQSAKKGANQYDTITFETTKAAGFNNYEILQIVPFNGFLFESIDLQDFKSVPVVQNNLMQNNRSRIATFYEFQARNSALAGEVYLYLKDKSRALIGATVNETNDFGTASFYLNFLDRPTKAFLVVKQKENVYALAYLKEYHPLIKQLIPLLF